MAGLAAVEIRDATPEDWSAIWPFLRAIVRAGETYTLPRDITRESALDYWWRREHEVFVAEEGGPILGTYFLQANQAGGGSHVANGGYVTAQATQGHGVARAMLEHSLARARDRGFRAMQFNFVVSTNERAIRTWQAYGFEIVGRLPLAFDHPARGFVDALVMYRAL